MEAVSHAEFASLRSDVADMKALMARMADAMTRLALLDERQQGFAETNKEILRRIDTMEKNQQQAALQAAAAGDTGSRIKNLEETFREMHIEREKDKARFQTVVWMIRGLWLVAGSGAAGVIFNLFQTLPK